MCDFKVNGVGLCARGLGWKKSCALVFWDVRADAQMDDSGLTLQCFSETFTDFISTELHCMKLFV